MPKFYCDFCDVFLTHDTLNVRRSHNAGWKHKANVRAYYAQFLEQSNPINTMLGQRAPNFSNSNFTGGFPMSTTISQPVMNYNQPNQQQQVFMFNQPTMTMPSFSSLPPLPNLSNLPPLPNQQK
jgi:hypothetical protein